MGRLYFLVAVAGILSPDPGFAFAKLSGAASAGFDRYVETAETRMNSNAGPGRYLEIDRRPELKSRLRGGEIIVESTGRSDDAKVPGAMLQDWRGMMFMSGATIQRAKSVLQDYDNYKIVYQPKVIESKQVSRRGDDYEVFLRLYEKHLVTVVLNTNYRVTYRLVDPDRLSVTSRSMRIAQVKDPKQSLAEEEPVGDDTGFLWRLNSYWRFEAADGGVYAECEAISLSRDVPLSLGWAVKGILERFPKESMLNTLTRTRMALEKLKSETGD